MFITFFFVILFFILAYLLLAPIILELDSSSGFLGIRFHHLAGSELKMLDNTFILILKIAGWEKRIDLLKSKPLKIKKQVEKTGSIRRPFSFNKIINVIRSFKVKKFVLSINTGDNQLNGILFPLFLLISAKSRKAISIDFRDETYIKLRIENNLARMIRAYIRS